MLLPKRSVVECLDLLLGDLVDQGLVDVGDDTSASDGGLREKRGRMLNDKVRTRYDDKNRHLGTA